MDFSKSRIPRFQETKSCVPPPNKYTPKSDIRVKGYVEYDYQRIARFNPGRCCNPDTRTRATSTTSTNSDKDSRKRKRAVERHVMYYESRKPKRRKTAVNVELPTEQESFTEDGSRLEDSQDGILNPTSEYVGPVDPQQSNIRLPEGAGEASSNAGFMPVMGANPNLLEKLEKSLQEIPEYCSNQYISTMNIRNAISDFLNVLKSRDKPKGEDSRLQELLAQIMQEESNRSEQEVELWTELQTTRGQLKLDEDRLKQVEDKAEFMETLNKAAVLNLQTSLANISNEHEVLQKLINEQQAIIEHRDRVMDQQRELLKGRVEEIDLLKGRLQQQDEETTTVQSTLDKRYRKADQVNKEISAQADGLKELFSTIDRELIEIGHLKEKLKTMEEERIKFKGPHAYHDALIAWAERVLKETET